MKPDRYFHDKKLFKFFFSFFHNEYKNLVKADSYLQVITLGPCVTNQQSSIQNKGKQHPVITCQAGKCWFICSGDGFPIQNRHLYIFTLQAAFPRDPSYFSSPLLIFIPLFFLRSCHMRDHSLLLTLHPSPPTIPPSTLLISC